MGVLKILSSKNSCKNIKNYLEKNDRAEEETVLNIDNPKKWAFEMQATKIAWDKKDGVQFYQIIDSFEREESKEHYNTRDVHAAGVLKAKMFSDLGYQVVVVTHNDTNHIHNHIIINSVNAENGKKLRISKAKGEQYKDDAVDIYARDIKKMNDEICKELGLHTLSESKKIKDQRTRSRGKQPESRKTDEIYAEEKGNSYKADMRDKLQQIWNDRDILTQTDFEEKIKQHGLSIARRTGTGTITYQDQYGHKVRAKNLGAFNQNDIDKLLTQNQQNRKNEMERIREEERQRALERTRNYNRSRGMSR